MCHKVYKLWLEGGRARLEHRRAGSLQGGRGGCGCNGKMNHSVVAGERQGAPWALPRWGPPQYYVQGLDVSQSVGVTNCG